MGPARSPAPEDNSSLRNLYGRDPVVGPMPNYSYNQALLTAELLKRNHRLNQEPILEKNIAEQKALQKLKRRM